MSLLAPLGSARRPLQGTAFGSSPGSFPLATVGSAPGSFPVGYRGGAPVATAAAGGAPVAPSLQELLDAIATVKSQKKAAQAEAPVVTTLKTSVLQQSEALVSRYYGLTGDGSQLKVQLDPEMGNALAAVSYSYDSQGRMSGETLHINQSQFSPDASANGVNGHVIQNDRIIAHEVTHAVMGRNMDWSALPNWFKEGTAEYLAGGAERAHFALDGMSATQLAGLAAEDWAGTSEQYASSYLAVRYLDATTQAGGGIKAVMDRLKDGASLDEAIAQVSGGAYSGEADFLAQWQQDAAAFVKTLDLSGRTPGAIDGARTGAQVVADQGQASAQPMTGFKVVWPSYATSATLATARAYGGTAYRQVAAEAAGASAAGLSLLA